ncbi:MAG: S8 family serine peptidase [Bacteroidales bacterium]|nr:S8 family serine peptidase [Bacteroidales bacterium]
MKKNLLVLVLLTIVNFGFAQYRIEPELLEVMNEKSDEMIRVNIIMKSQIDTNILKDIASEVRGRDERREVIVNELMRFANSGQEALMEVLQAETKRGDVTKVRQHWLVNAINCEASRDVIYEISQRHDVATIAYDKDEFLLWDEKMEKVEASKGLTQNITHINADDVWDLGFTGEGILVGLIDTGVNINHVDLVNNLWDGGEEYPNHGYNTYENNHDVEDGFGHGTHCAGTICGDGSSGTQTGIAPNAKIICVKVMDNAGYGSASSISAGMEFAIEHGADVLSMSLGIPNASASVKEMLRAACDNTLQIGIAAAVAAGNEGMLNISFPVPNNLRVPGGCPPPWIHPDQEINSGGTSCSITVGAVDYQNQRAAFSSMGPYTWENTSYNDYPYDPEIGLIRPDIVAPGVGIISADPYSNSGLVTMDGTSQAAPCVAGVMCLMLEKNPELTPEEICYILENTAVKLTENKDNYTGSGCIDALAAINNIEGGDVVIPCNAPTSVTATTIDEYSISISWDANDNAKSYNVYRNENLINNTEETSFIDTDLNPDTEYCYTVTSVCEDGESEHSEQSCATTNELIIPCNAPTNLVALVEEDLADFDFKFRVTLSWDAVDNAVSYSIFMNNELVEETTTPLYIYGTDVEETVTFAVMTNCETNESEMSETLDVEIVYQSIKEYEKRFDFYPNPIEDYLHIVTNENINKIEVYNVIGVMVLMNDATSDKINLSALNSGVYFIKIKTDKGTVVKSVLKS